MTRTNLLILAALWAGVPAAAGAQNNAAPSNVVTPAPAPREGTVGPEQLRDFALPGTRQAPPAEAQRPVPAPAPAPSTPSPSTARSPASTAPVRPEVREEPARAVREAPAADSPVNAPAATVTTPTPPPVTAAPLDPVVSSTVEEPPAPIAVTEPSVAAPSLLPGWWPWALVAALTGIGLALALRQRRKPVLAGHGQEHFERVAAEPLVPPRSPAPASAPAPEKERVPASPLPSGLVTTRLRQPAPPPPPPPPPVSGGVVSRRLRGWVDIDLVVREILFSEAEALLRVDLAVINNGTAAARDIALEAVTLNASDGQAAELDAFFERPSARAVAVQELGPLSDTAISHELRIPRAAIRAYEAQGRTLFVPVLALNAVYRTGSTEGRTSAAFLIGREVPGAEKLAPLLLPAGAGRLVGLGVRRLEEAVRR